MTRRWKHLERWKRRLLLALLTMLIADLYSVSQLIIH